MFAREIMQFPSQSEASGINKELATNNAVLALHQEAEMIVQSNVHDSV